MATQEDIIRLADISYASQTTGVSSALLAEALEAVGLESGIDGYMAGVELLTSNGYQVGTSDFYVGANTSGPQDAGLRIHYEAVQRAKNEYGYLDSTEANKELYGGQINPETGELYNFIINDSGANAILISEGLAAQGLSSTDSVATSFSPSSEETAQSYTQEYDTQNQSIGGNLDNSLQWAAFDKLKKKPVVSDTSSSFTPFTPSVQAPAITAPAGAAVPVQAVPQVVTQQVTPPSYFNQPQIAANTSISNEQAGTFSKPLQTAGLSAVPQEVTYSTHYAGTPGLVNPTLMASTGSATGGTQQVPYENQATGQEMSVTELGGNPVTYVPPGFTRKKAETVPGVAEGGYMQGYAPGGDVQADKMLEAKFRIASMNGYSGPKTNSSLNAYANASPAMTAKFNAIGATMNQGGMVKEPGTIYAAEGALATTPEQFKGMQQNLVAQTMQPMQSNVEFVQPSVAQYVPVDAGQATPIAPYAEAATVETVQQANLPTASNAATFDSLAIAPQVAAETAGMTAAQGTVSTQAQTTAQQQLTSGVTDMTAAQGTATMVNAPAAREIQSGEIISGVADAEKAATFNEQIQAATATPSAQATVAGQLEGLMQQFEGGATPTWAAGSMRAATATLAARGLGASSMAGQAVIQATMEAAIPIAQMDAQVQAQFEGQNLSNRQARAMLSAQQRAQFLGMEFDQAFQSRVANSARIGDIANMNFTAEQNIAMENSRAANTMNLSNLSNSQAMVMAEAAALSNLDMANLNNRQQSAVQNAQNFMQMDMTNLSNDQQTTMFKSQQNIQALFTDQAAENASKQFNAASENQTNQFFSNLTGQTAQFNASQQNAMDQFNINSVNALREFNSNIQQQRDMFNAQNGLVIAQSNAQWRQNLDTLNTSELNESNRNFAATMNGLTAGNLEQVWQRERDIMSFAFSSAESSKDRALQILLGDMEIEALEKKLEAGESAGKTKFLLDIFEDPIKNLAVSLFPSIP